METEILKENRRGIEKLGGDQWDIGMELYFALTAHWLREVATCAEGFRWFLWHKRATCPTSLVRVFLTR